MNFIDTIFFTWEGRLFGCLLVAVIIIAIALNRISKKRVGLLGAATIEYGALQIRLNRYAQMIGYEPSVPTVQPLQLHSYPLSVGEHKILLGVLKKIEAKNAVLAAVNIFLLAAGSKIYYDLRFSLNEYQRPLFLVTLLILFIVLIARLDGNGHIGQGHFNKLRERAPVVGAPTLGARMQYALMEDLLRKEAVFEFSFRIIAGAFFSALAVIVLGFIG